MNIVKSQTFEIALTILVNLLSDLSWSIIYIVFLFYEVPDKILHIIIFIFSVLVFLRLLVLPIYYNWLEKRTQNELIKIFIQRLRYSFVTKIFMLFPISYVITILCDKLMNWHLNINIFAIIPYIVISILLGSMGNYLVLFAYWFIVDLYKKIRQNH